MHERLQQGFPITTPFIPGAHLPSYLPAGGSAPHPLLQHMVLLEQSQNPLGLSCCKHIHSVSGTIQNTSSPQKMDLKDHLLWWFHWRLGKGRVIGSS